MKIQWTIGTVTVAVAMVIVFGFLITGLAHGEEAGQVSLEVMKACKHHDTDEVLIPVMMPGSMGRAPTLKEIDEYVASEKLFKETTKGSSPCWTRERWKRYTRATFMEQRASWEKAMIKK